MCDENVLDAAIREYRLEHPVVAARLWNDDACLELAIAIIEGAEEAYVSAKLRTIAEPDDPRFRCEYKLIRKFFFSEYFHTLSMGYADSGEVVSYLDSVVERIAKRRFQIVRGGGIV